MSTKYKYGDYIPSQILCSRLRELSSAVTQGKKADRSMTYLGWADAMADQWSRYIEMAIAA